MNLLKFQKGNAKLDKVVYTFSLPSGFTCPQALECLSKADKQTGKITDGKSTAFRCFSASQEALYKNVRASRWYNFDVLKNALNEYRSLPDNGSTTDKRRAMAWVIQKSLPKKAKIVRIHVAGDFFSQDYFDAWVAVARENPGTLFYAYTKSLSYWINRKDSLPDNFVLTASYGGRQDELISLHSLRSAVVVYSEKEASDKGLEIDHDDSHAMQRGGNFALLIHGVQPKGTEASKALSVLKKAGNSGYNKANRQRLTLAVV